MRIRERHGLLVPLLSTLAVSAALLSGCTGDSDGGGGPGPGTAVRGLTPAPVALTTIAERAGESAVRIGVLVSLRAEPGQGQEVLASAEGARVAAYRMQLGGGEVRLEVADDGGTTGGATAAIDELIEANVSGIVVASTGSHLESALREASEAGVPVLLPHDRTIVDLPDGVWATGPDTAVIDRTLLAAMEEEGHSRPFLISADGVQVSGLGSADAEEFGGSNLRRLLDRIDVAVEQGRVDSVVVAAGAATQAELVAAIQGRFPEVPVILTPEALSPDFAAGLAVNAGTTAGQFLTVGVDASDATTLGRGPRAEAAASYFAALRLAASDENVMDLHDSVSFAEVASGADTASHDAVVAIASAVAAADSTDPAEVLAAFDDLTVSLEDGLAGPTLDFSTARALDPEAVVPLRATTQDPGVRPIGPRSGRLFWFATGSEQ